MWSELNNAATHRRSQICKIVALPALTPVCLLLFLAWKAEEEILILLQEPGDRARQGALRTRQPLGGGTTGFSGAGSENTLTKL